ncbi:MAG: MFS transporter, partial [Chloroflexota bacterium]|nr:MFS transporter [Chloroflexota bacterium]
GFKSSAEVFVGPFAGLLSDKYGRLRTLIISASVFSVGLSLLGLFDSLIVIYALLFLAFTGGVMLMMQLLSLVGVIAEGDRKSDIFSCYNTFQDVGSAIGPFMGLSLIQGENLGMIYLLSGLLVYFLIICLCFYYRNTR